MAAKSVHTAQSNILRHGPTQNPRLVVRKVILFSTLNESTLSLGSWPSLINSSGEPRLPLDSEGLATPT